MLRLARSGGSCDVRLTSTYYRFIANHPFLDQKILWSVRLSRSTGTTYHTSGQHERYISPVNAERDRHPDSTASGPRHSDSYLLSAKCKSDFMVLLCGN